MHSEKNRAWRIIVEIAAIAGTFVVLMGLFTVALGDGCAWLHSGEVVKDIVDCTVPAVDSEANNLLDAVKAILEGNAVDWEQQLASLESNGVWALGCAVRKALDYAPPDAGVTARMASVSLRAKNRAKQYLQDKGYKFNSDH